MEGPACPGPGAQRSTLHEFRVRSYDRRVLTNRSRPPGEVIPTLYYEDVEKAIDWLCGAFSFTERFRYGQSGNVGGAQLVAGGGIVMLSRVRVGQNSGWGDNAAFKPPPDGEISILISVHVDDVDRHFERAKQFGARIVRPPETYPFGERQYTAQDIAGHRWAFSQSVADVAPEAWGATSGPALIVR
jgi:uncharacterized glyoxalase superfamily protein PhnB